MKRHWFLASLSLICLLAFSLAWARIHATNTATRQSIESSQSQALALRSARDAALVAKARTAASLKSTEDDLDKLLTAIPQTKQFGQNLARKTAENLALGRLQEADKKLAAKDYPAALELYLWCLKVGFKNPDAQTNHWPQVMDKLKPLLQAYAPAREAFRELSNELEKQLLAKPGNVGSQLAILNETLGLGSRTVYLYDQLASNRQLQSNGTLSSMVVHSPDSFIEAKRYSEVLSTAPYRIYSYTLDHRIETVDAWPKQQETLAHRSQIISDYLPQLEALAGTNDLEHASSVAKRLLAQAQTPADRSRLQAALTRAGHPELWDKLTTQAP